MGSTVAEVLALIDEAEPRHVRPLTHAKCILLGSWFLPVALTGILSLLKPCGSCSGSGSGSVFRLEEGIRKAWKRQLRSQRTTAI